MIHRLVSEYDHQFKFVVDTPADVTEVLQYLEEFPEIDGRHVQLMPQGTSSDRLAAIARWLEPRCAEMGFTYCPRMHIEWYGLTRRT
ncbi:MAG: hypothetical protein R3C10_00050 [Pirellulales bacterium]